MKIGITGGFGFIGQHVVEAAIQRGHHVIVVDHKGRSVPNLELTYNGKDWSTYDLVTSMKADVRDATAMCEVAAHVGGIIHLAACLGTQETISNPGPAAETNIMGGLNVLQAVRQYDIPMANIAVGNWWMNNSYSISKYTIERYIKMYNTEHQTRINVVRLVNAYGPRQSVAPPYGDAKVRKITPAFVCRALTGSNIEVYGDGEQISDMVHVKDGALALVLALEAAAQGKVFEEPIECGPVEHATVNEVAQQVIYSAVGLGFDPVQLVHLPMRPGEIPGAKVTADSQTLRLIGMDPKGLIPLELGIQQTVEWYVENWLPFYLKEQAA